MFSLGDNVTLNPESKYYGMGGCWQIKPGQVATISSFHKDWIKCIFDGRHNKYKIYDLIPYN